MSFLNHGDLVEPLGKIDDHQYSPENTSFGDVSGKITPHPSSTAQTLLALLASHLLGSPALGEIVTALIARHVNSWEAKAPVGHSCFKAADPLAPLDPPPKADPDPRMNH